MEQLCRGQEQGYAETDFMVSVNLPRVGSFDSRNAKLNVESGMAFLREVPIKMAHAVKFC